MANKAISELPQAQNVNNQDLFVLEQSGIAKKLTAETFITEQGIIDALAEALDGHGGIQSVTLSSVSGRIRTYLITFTDETTTTFQVLDGTSIDRVTKTSTAGLVDTYTIFMNDGTTTFFTVTNGADGTVSEAMLNDALKDKAPAITETASGAIANFSDGADDLVMHNVVVKINPVQSGSGDPSPDNIRPISGWTGVTISHSGADTSNPETISISWQSEAGIVYGGTIDVATGLLTVTDIMAVVDGTLNTVVTEQSYNGTQGVFAIGVPNFPHITKGNADKFGAICNRFKEETFNHAVTTGYDNVFALQGNYSRNIVFRKTDLTSKSAWTNWLSSNPLQVVYKLATPQTYQLTPQEVKTLLGTNNVWADTGNVTVEYSADTELYLEKDQLRQNENLAYVETSSTASRAYSVGDFFVNEDGILCEITTSVSANGTLIESTNYTVIGGNGGLGSAVVSKSSFAFDSVTQTLTITVT